MLDPGSPYVRVARGSILARLDRLAEAPGRVRRGARGAAAPRPRRSPSAARCGCGWASSRRRGATSTRRWRSTRATRPPCCGEGPRSCAAPSPRRRSRTSTRSPAATRTPPGRRSRSSAPRRCSRSGAPEEALGDLEGTPASALDAQMLAIRGEARLKLGRPGEALADAQHALEQHATHDAARAVLVQSFLAVAATIPPPSDAGARLKANRTLVERGRARGRLVPRPAEGAARLARRTPSSCCGCAAAGVRARCSAASPFSSPPSR